MEQQLVPIHDRRDTKFSTPVSMQCFKYESDLGDVSKPLLTVSSNDDFINFISIKSNDIHEKDGTRIFNVHEVLLKRHCFSYDEEKVGEEDDTLDLSDDDYEYVRIFVQFLYYGRGGVLRLCDAFNWGYRLDCLIDAWDMGKRLGADHFQNAIVDAIFRIRDNVDIRWSILINKTYQSTSRGSNMRRFVIELFCSDNAHEDILDVSWYVQSPDAKQDILSIVLDSQHRHYFEDGFCEAYHTHRHTSQCAL